MVVFFHNLARSDDKQLPILFRMKQLPGDNTGHIKNLKCGEHICNIITQTDSRLLDHCQVPENIK